MIMTVHSVDNKLIFIITKCMDRGISMIDVRPDRHADNRETNDKHCLTISISP